MVVYVYVGVVVRVVVWVCSCVGVWLHGCMVVCMCSCVNIWLRGCIAVLCSFLGGSVVASLGGCVVSDGRAE